MRRRVSPNKLAAALGGPDPGGWRKPKATFAPCPGCNNMVATGAECLWCDDGGHQEDSDADDD